MVAGSMCSLWTAEAGSQARDCRCHVHRPGSKMKDAELKSDWGVGDSSLSPCTMPVLVHSLVLGLPLYRVRRTLG